LKLHKVTKVIDFCYGHRLLKYDGKCKNLHGHNGVLEIDISSNKLDDRGMVMDFGDIKGIVKSWIDENLDHKMILSVDDPMVEALQSYNEPLYIMDVNPTAENIVKYIYEIILALGITPLELRLWETPSSYASYSEG
tara:strand:+ start:2392 stop:2802 length:411 start_codon:yes stop_codon:yes gene_type:complete